MGKSIDIRKSCRHRYGYRHIFSQSIADADIGIDIDILVDM